MEPSGTYKKATAALDEAARARLRGPFVAGDAAPSPAPSWRADADVDDDLVDLVDEFYNGDGEQRTGRVAAKDDAAAPRPAEWKETLRAALADAAADAVASRIRAEVERAVRDAGPAAVAGGAARMRLVKHLRTRGFNAGLCRSSWERSGGVPAPGTHEYVDVTAGSPLSPSRYVVEVNVAAEFEIARPSAAYRGLLLSLPPVLVARPEALGQVAAAMCAAAAESIRGAGMHVPPWRRAPYVQAKWSAQYERVEAVAPVGAAPAREAGATPVRARRPGGRKHCGMEMGRREGAAMGREALVSVRPLFRGL
ncbi:hypothetical protein ACP4OV_000195 [Aristida adscensionis]